MVILPAALCGACQWIGPEPLRSGVDARRSETVIDGHVYGFGPDGREPIPGVVVEVAEWIEPPTRADGDTVVFAWPRDHAYRVIRTLTTDVDGRWSIVLPVPGEYGMRYTPPAGSPYQCTPWRHRTIREACAVSWHPTNLCNLQLTPERCLVTFRNAEPRGCAGL